jgi:hypothetical protein
MAGRLNTPFASGTHCVSWAVVRCMLREIFLCSMHPHLSLARYAFVVLAAGMLTVTAMAETLLWGGRPEFGVEYEHEKMADNLSHGKGLTLIPSLSFKNGPIHRIDLLFEGERDKEVSDGVTSFSNLYKVAVRVRKNIPLQGDLGMYFRGLVGRAKGESESYYYGYSYAVLRYERGFFGFIMGVRVQRSLDGSSGHDVNKFRLGPSFDIGEHHELELRWARSWDAHTHAHESDSYIAEYTYKF